MNLSWIFIIDHQPQFSLSVFSSSIFNLAPGSSCDVNILHAETSYLRSERSFASSSFSAALSVWRRVPSACVGDGERQREREKKRQKQRMRAYLQKPSPSGALSSRSSVKSAELAETCAQELRNVTHTHTQYVGLLILYF